jgi:transketolase
LGTKSSALREKAKFVRSELLKMIHHAGAGHTGGALSSVDILVSLFYGVMKYDPECFREQRHDRFVLSKGHSCEAYYVILSDLGFFPKEELSTFMRYQSRLMGHPHPKIPGVEVATGSLGHGLSIAAGMALAGKIDGSARRVFCLLGDGELSEGSVWEAANAASHYKLDNLVGIIDYNGLQIAGAVEKVMNPQPLDERWKAFGWEVVVLDGHDPDELVRTFGNAPFVEGKPTMVIARTVKGKGVSFMENKAEWHHRVPTQEELAKALEEITA